MSGPGLTSEQLKQQHSGEIAEIKTFKTHGVSEQAAKDYLDTPEGTRYWLRLKEADPTAPASKIDERAIGQLTSGSELPRMETINEPLVKIVPQGSKVSPYSPFFARESAFEEALAKGHNLSEHFALPIASEAPVYDVYKITPSQPTEVFANKVAPTSELGGQVTKAGGGEQLLVPNRKLYGDPVYVKSLGNDLVLHNELVVGKGLGARIAPLAESAARGAHPGVGVAAKGLGAVGAAVTAYDAADTFHDVTRLQGQNNPTAAQARIERFATQNAGGWAGAVTFAGVGAAAGVESGPGLLVTGAIGGIVGAVAGDKVADWLNERKINRQDDRDGNTWTFDPKRPDQGWTREVPTKELDQEATIYAQGMPVYKTQTLKASPELTDELTYKASSTSIALALGSPPQNRNPYALPANDQDMRSLQDAPWERNAQTGQWKREVVTSYLEHGLPVTQTETANPQRTAELERQSQEVVAKNAAQTPAAMAAAFQSAYEQNGWSRHGPLPEAVQDAKGHPGRIVGSDGDLYERGANGQWTHDGLLWDSTAEHNLKRELDATHQQQQQNLTIPTLAPVEVLPDPPSAAPPTPTPAAAPSRSSPADRDHPDHAMLEQIRTGVRKIDEGIGKPYDEMSERISRSLLAACKDNRDAYPNAVDKSLSGYALSSVDHVIMGKNGNIFAVEGRLDSESHKRASVSVEEAIRTPVEQSDAKVLAANQTLTQERDLARQQELARGHDDPSRSGPKMS